MNERTKTGLVGFFDILGYQNLLERNEPEVIAQDVLPLLLNIKTQAIELLKDIYSELRKSGQHNEISDIFESRGKSIEWLVFSDTVLLTLDIDESSLVCKMACWLNFLAVTLILMKELFMAGLPLRGAIDYGKFFIDGNCFAGRTIVEAHRLGGQLELSACVLTDHAAKIFRSIPMLYDLLYGKMIVEYLVPMKSGEQHMSAVAATVAGTDNPDIHSEVMKSFWKNKKDISHSATVKAQNTEQWLDFLRLKTWKDK